MKAGKMIKGYLAAIASAVLFGCMPLMANYIYADGVNPMTLVFLRNFLALPLIAVLALLQNRSLKLPGKLLPRVCITALVGNCLTPTLLFSSYRFIASGTATVFHFIYPALVVLGSILLKREKAKLGNIISVILCFVGILLFYDPGEPLDWRGSLLALVSGVTFAAYVILLSHRDTKQVPGFLFSFYVGVSCSLVMFVLCLVTGQLALPQSLLGWGLCALFSVGITCCAVVLFQVGTFLVGGQQASILSTIEPITSVIVGVVIFQEAVGLRTLFGVLLVVSASVLIPLSNFKPRKKAHKKTAV